MKWMEKLKPWQLAVLSGILIGFAYIPGPQLLAWIAFLPFFLLLRKDIPTKKKVFYSWITQYILTLIGFHWVAHTIIEFGQMPKIFGYLGLMAFCAFANLHFCISTWLYEKIFAKKSPLSLLSFCILFVLSEWFFPMIFPWHMGYSWITSGLPLMQMADVFGFWGLSLLTLLINLAFYYFIINFKRRTLAVSFVGVMLVMNLVGYWKQQNWEKTDTKTTFYIAQANIGNFFKHKAEQKGRYKDYIIDEYINLSRNDLTNRAADYVVWPETAMPLFMNLGRLNSQYTRRIADLAREFQTPIITGVYSYRGDQIFNSIGYIGSDGIMKDMYSKHHLLAFGEYFPGTENRPKLRRLVEKYIPAISHFGRGEGSTVFRQNNDFVMGPQICYEGLYPNYVAQSVKNGATLLLNVTNDSWFGNTFEPYQHMYMTLARAIEFRRPLVRATNTGISTAIEASGKVLEMSELREKKGYYFDISYQQSPRTSWYTKSAGIQPYILLVIWLTLTLYIRKRNF
tara:strand:+ start:2332 stop:3864 length:1533 start_codon:yes stop_codon:yes gene_type:complete